jgi:superfamily II DNA or RNA helicase
VAERDAVWNQPARSPLFVAELPSPLRVCHNRRRDMATPYGSTLDAPPPPTPGRIVRVRSRRWLVDDVVAPPAPGDATLVRLACLEDDAQGEALEVLWELEVDADVVPEGASSLRLGERGFDAPRLFAAYLNTLRWSGVTATDARLFQAPWRAGIDVKAYQLEPLRKALLLPRVNLFIADDVGLGKTIEAGLITRELLMRQKARRVVVCCPPSVVLQWRDEMEQRFGLLFRVMDRDFVARRRRARGYGVNPWTTHSRFILSHALLRDDTYQAGLREWLDDDETPALLIVDEAHNAAPASGARYAIDSQFTHALRQVSALFEHRLFLSATPHNGHSNSFSALLEMLDPQRFCRGVSVRNERARLEAVMVRRLKRDLRAVPICGFPRREPVQIDLDGLPANAPELRLPVLLERYVEARTQRLGDASKSVQAAATLVTTSLQKRLLSSIEAFARTLRVHAASFERHAVAAAASAPPLPRDLSALREAPGADDERAALPEDEQRAEEEAALEGVTRATTQAPGGALDHERALLHEMAAIAEDARTRPDPRVLRLVEWLRRELCPGDPPRWNARRVLIFTEYVDTQRYLMQQLRAALIAQGALRGDPDDPQDARLAAFHGQMDDERREELKRAFNADPTAHPLRVLIATDAAREGVNLQNHCADLFHFDVPWNPSRMEQRNGRIDRVLQRAPVVRCHYFFHAQRPHDRVLEALVHKSATIAEELGSLAPVLDERLARLLDRGIRAAEADELAGLIRQQRSAPADDETVVEELEQAREEVVALRRQLDELRGAIERSERALGFDPAAFRDALSCALELLGAESLRPEGTDGRYVFPALDRRDGADPTWADTLDSLRPPRPRDQRLWEWRRGAPLRPVVFKDPGTLDDSVVHLHLEHRVVRRLLGRFLSQGFVHHDLSRVCVARTSAAVPRVLLLGRLSLYGAGAARLHDEIVTVAARWSDPDARREPLAPFAAEAEDNALRLLHEALLAPGAGDVDQAVRARLARSLPRDLGELQTHLEARAAEAERRARRLLDERGEREARDMAEILRGQRARVTARVQGEIERREAAQRQPRLAFGETDAAVERQIEADLRHWRRRLEQLDDELRREPERVRQVYAVRTPRVETVGLVYLWPASG